MIDIVLFRKDKGGNPDLIRESQKRRFADVTLVDKVIKADDVWRRCRGKLDLLNKMQNLVNGLLRKKLKGKKKGESSGGDDGESNKLPKEVYDDIEKYLKEKKYENLNASQLKELKKHFKVVLAETKVKQEETLKERLKYQGLIGNLVHNTCVISDNEDNNGLVKKWGKFREEKGLLNHVDLMEKLKLMNTEAGANVAGKRGYYLLGALVELNLALQQYGVTFLKKRGYTAIYPPFFMKRTAMQQVAQLEQFHEELYIVGEDSKHTVSKKEKVEKKEEKKKKLKNKKAQKEEAEEKYLIATSEQPIAAYHLKERIPEKSLPVRYCGLSTCFRKEVGSHGRDTLGIFRVHQFEKIEQFCITSPKDGKSWKMFDDMLKNSEDFYQSLGIPYRLVNIVSGKLNNAAAKKIDLEAWFPASKTFRELVSCSNCTDYQSRRLDIRYGQTSNKKKGGKKEYVHMLNATLCATSRAMCCILENYQTKEGINVPKVLQPYLGQDFIPFPKKKQKKKKNNNNQQKKEGGNNDKQKK